jgi:hypothetical protein
MDWKEPGRSGSGLFDLSGGYLPSRNEETHARSQQA